MTIEYRNAGLEKAACIELFGSTGWNRVYGLTEAEYFEAMRQSWHVVGAYDGEQLVGLGRIISDGQLYALIVDVIVLPQYRGIGVGTTIMEHLLERGRAGCRNGCGRVVWQPAGARAVYSSLPGADEESFSDRIRRVPIDAAVDVTDASKSEVLGGGRSVRY